MKKRIFSLTLALVLVLGLLPGGASAAGETKTISTKAELEAFRDSVNGGDTYEGKTVTLTADIDLGGGADSQWTPIGKIGNTPDQNKPFKGTFDGQGHKITGLYIDSASDYQGLFGLVGSGGTVKNLGVGGTVTGGFYVGGVVGSNSGTVTGCYNMCAVTGTGSLIGGVAGSNGRTVTNCYNMGAVSGGDKVGGVVGNLGSTATVSNCYNTGTVSGALDARDVHAVVGYWTGGDVSNCFYSDTCGASDGWGTKKKTAAEFASGEVAWLLQKGQESEPFWGQGLRSDKDAYPLLTNDSTKEVYKVTFMADGREHGAGYTNSGGTVSLPDAPDMTGRTFDKWATAETDGTEFTTDTTITADTTVYAQFKHAHVWANSIWESNASGHWRPCRAEGCDITDYSTCGETGAAYAAHTPGDWQTDGTNHWKACSECGYEQDKAAHVYDDGQDTTCNTCGYVRTVAPPHTHVWATGWSNDANGHWHACTAAGCAITDYAACAEPGAAYAAHIYDNDQDTACNTCGYTRTVTPPAPDEGGTEGKVEVKPGTPAVTVDEAALKELAGTPAEGESVTVTFTVEKKAEADVAQAGAIRQLAGGQKLDFLDLSLVRTVTASDGSSADTPITDTSGRVLEIVVPYDFTGKAGVTVYRYHNGGAEALTQADTGAGGTFRLDSASVIIYATKFSTYAIGYTENTPTPPPTPSYGGGSSSSVTYYTLTASAGQGGAISPSGSVRVRRSQNRTFTITPDEGYVVADILVDGRSVGAAAEYAFDRVTANHTIFVSFRLADPRPVWNNPFADVDAGQWFYDSVRYVYERGLMVGTDAARFSPARETSRGMIAAIIWRLAGSPEPRGQLTYTDCGSGAYYARAVAWGTENGVLHGCGGGRFAPGDPVTREQLAVMLWRYAGSPAAGKELSFADADRASGYARDALRWAVENGILTGSDGLLNPGGPATRAQVAQMLKCFIESREGNA